MEIQAEKRFQELKRKLDALHYWQPITIESTALVERLLNDFLKTMNGFQQLKKKQNQIMAELETEKNKITPLSRENERVVKENNDLHHAIIEANEQAQEVQLTFNREVLRYKSEIEDLKFVITTKDGKIKQFEEQAFKVKNNLSGSDQFWYGNNLNGSIEITSPLKDATKSRLNQPDVQLRELEDARKHWADELVKADERAATLNAEIKRLNNSKTELEDTIRLQREKLEARDREISRLNSMTANTPNIDKLSQAYSAEVSQANIQKLNNQIDFLNRENQRLEDSVKEKEQIINTAEKYKQDRMAMGLKFTELQAENKRLMGDIHQMETVIGELKENIEENNSVIAKRKLVPLDDLNKERQKRDELQDRIREIETELRQYKRADEHSQHWLSTAEADKKVLNKRMEEVIEENRTLHNEIDDKNQEIRQAQKERDILRSDADFYKDRAKQMESNYEKHKRLMQEVSQEKDMTEEEKLKYHNKLMDLENQLADAKRSCSETTFEIERYKRQQDLFESEITELKQQSFKYKQEFENSNTTLTRLQIENETSKKQLLYSEKEITSLQEELGQKIKQLGQKDKELTNLNLELKSSQESHNIMRSEHKMLSDELTETLNELETEKKRRREVEREAMTSSGKNYQEVCSQLIIAERRAIEGDEKWKESQQYKQELEDKQQLIDQLKIKQGEQIEYIENLQREVKKLQYDIDVEKERVKNYKDSKDKVDYELRETRRNLADIQDRLNDGRNETIVSEQQKNQVSIENEDLRNQVKNLKKDKNNLNDDNSVLRKQIEDLQLNITKQQSEITKLECLIQTHERSKEDLIHKLQNTTKERNNDERDKSSLVTEIGNLKKSIVAKEAEISEMRSSVIELDQRNDMLQSQLDYKTEELYQTQNALEQQNKENIQSKNKFSVIANKEESYERRLQEREREIDELKKQLKAIHRELHELKEMDNLKAHDTHQLSNDLEILTRENHTIKEQLMKLSEEKEYFKIELENMTGRNKQLQQNIRVIENEKSDLEVVYKELCSENQRFKNSMNSMNNEHKDSSGRIKGLERDLQGAYKAIQELEEREQQMIYDLQQYEHNVSALTRQVEILEKDCVDAREARDSLLQDQEAQRNLSFNLEVNKEDLQRHVMSLDHERNILHSKIDELQRDLQLQRERSEYERERYYELEQLLNNERIEKAHIENEILNSTAKKNDPFLMRRSGTISDYDEESSYTMGSSNRSYDNRNKLNLQKVVSQLESEIEKEDQEKAKVSKYN